MVKSRWCKGGTEEVVQKCRCRGDSAGTEQQGGAVVQMGRVGAEVHYGLLCMCRGGSSAEQMQMQR